MDSTKALFLFRFASWSRANSCQPSWILKSFVGAGFFFMATPIKSSFDFYTLIVYLLSRKSLEYIVICSKIARMAYAPKNLIDKNCEQCGKAFKAKPNFLKMGKARFCSKTCSVRNRPIQPVEERLWENIDRSGGDDACWPYMKTRMNTGYGVLWTRGILVYAHRLVFQLQNGPLVKGEFVLHRCDNPPCCNPAHLFKGSHTDNMRDMVAKGRHNPPRPLKLSDANVEAIIALCAVLPKISRPRIAKEFGVCTQTIYNLLNGVFYTPRHLLYAARCRSANFGHTHQS
jgi:hypothetical protein